MQSVPRAAGTRVTLPLADVLAFRSRLRPVLSGGFMDLVAETERQLVAGRTLGEVRAELTRVRDEADEQTQRGMYVRRVCEAVLLFLEARG